MGLEAIYPNPGFLGLGLIILKGVGVDKPDHAWDEDITYIRMIHGFLYLEVILDLASRCLFSWELSITLEKAFCLEALRRAFLCSKPEIFNTDQGRWFTRSLVRRRHIDDIGYIQQEREEMEVLFILPAERDDLLRPALFQMGDGF